MAVAGSSPAMTDGSTAGPSATIPPNKEFPMLTYYFAPGSSSMAPHIALQEIGVPYEPRPLSFAQRGTHTPEYLALNPDGKVRCC